MPRVHGFRAAIAVAMTAAALAAPGAAHADSPGLVGAYGFEEPTGTTAVDSSAGGNPGTLAGATRTGSGRFGQALTFDGADDRVNVADSASLDLTTGMTLEAWVNPSASAGSWRTVVIKEQAAGLAYALYSGEDSSRPSVHAYTSGEYDSRGPATLPLNTWSHLAATYDGGTLRLYVNGSQVAGRALAGAMTTSSSALRIGGNAIWGEYFKGLIDEVRVYNRALTAAEVGVDMNAPVVASDTTPPTAPTGLSAAVTGDDIRLIWTASTDAVGVTEYRVHRSASAGFIPTAANRVGLVSGPLFIQQNQPDGAYYYKVVAADAAGNASAASNEAGAAVEPDTTAPFALTVNAGCDPGRPLRDAFPFASYAQDDRAVTYLQLKLDGENFGQASTRSPLLSDWDTRTASNGPHVLTLVARDAAGNEATHDCHVTVDNKPLSVVIDSPADGSAVRGTITLAGTTFLGDDPTGSSYVRWKIDGVAMPYQAGLPPFSRPWDTTAVADGPHTVTADMYYIDYSQPQATKSVQVNVDNSPQPDTTAPAVTVSGTCDGATISNAGPISAYATDDRRVTYLQIKLDGENLGPAETQRNYVTADWDTRTASNGPHVLSAVARDAAGNETTSAPCPVTVANKALSVDFTSPTDGATVGGTVTLSSAGLADDQPIANLNVRYKVDGVLMPFVGGGPTRPWDTTAVPNGIHSLTVDLYWADYSSPQATKTIQVDVRNTSPTAPSSLTATVTGGDDVGLSWGASSDDGGVTGYRVHRSTSAGFTPSEANRIVTVTGTTYSDSDRPAGTYRYRVVAVDGGGLASPPSNEASATVAPPAPTGLVAAYGFEETSGGTVADGSGNGRTGTISGATRSAAGKFGRTLSFDGVNDLVTVPDGDALDFARNMTLEAWVNPTTITGAWRTVAIKERPGGLVYALYAGTDNGRPGANVFAGGNEFDAFGTSQIALNTWTHLAMTLDATTLRLYVNGTQVATRGVSLSMAASTGALKIGGNNVWPEWFKGLIDEVRVYNRALTATEIQVDRDRPVGP